MSFDLLLERTQYSDFFDRAGIQLLLVEVLPHGITVKVLIEPDYAAGTGPREIWTIRCRPPVQYSINRTRSRSDSMSGVRLKTLGAYREHPALRVWKEPYCTLGFCGKPDNLHRVLGELVEAHYKTTDNWDDFRVYLNDEAVDFMELLGSSYGFLATGPKWVLSSYAAVLQRNGIEAYFVPDSENYQLDETQRNALIAFLFDDSIIIGNDFTAECCVE